MNRYETHVFQNPQLPFFFHPIQHHLPNSERRGANWHENIEIIAVTKGNGIVTVDTEPIPVCEGEITVINANRLHSFSTQESHMIYRCLIVERAFCIANHFDTNAINFDPHFSDAVLNDLFEALNAEYQTCPQKEFSIPTIRALVLTIMARLCREHAHPLLEEQRDSGLLSAIKQAIGYIRSKSHEELSLDEVSRFVGLSKYYFAREFYRITGYTFVAFVNLTRCENAKLLLTEGHMNIGDVGRTCGFGNQSYFSRTFLKYTGMLPREYREQHTH